MESRKMTHTNVADPAYQRDLGNGLILRWSRPEDTEDIVHLTSSVFRDGPEEPLNTTLGNLMRLVMSGDGPLMSSNDFALVEDTHKKSGRIVACTCLWRQDWAYEDISFAIGRPEIVATDPAYRNRGLVRALFELIHGRSEAEGHFAQGITGIPYFYRQFGYEFALDLEGTRTTFLSQLPQVREDVQQPYLLRDATLEDISMIHTLYERQRALMGTSTPIPVQWWQHQIEMWGKVNVDGYWRIQMIIDAAKAPIGYVVTYAIRWKQSLPVLDLAVAAGINLQAVLPSVLHALQTQIPTYPARDNAGPVSKITFILGRTHLVNDALGKMLAPVIEPPYAWYVRVPDLPRFIKHIAPALEKRLAVSAVAGYSRDLKLNFYRGGLRLVFERGHITAVEDWQRPIWGSSEDASFPPLVFLQMLFGYRSLDELRHAFPDVTVKDETELLMKTLFPVRPSWVVALG